MLSMSYSTPASPVRAGQGVFFVYSSSSFWVHWPSWSTLDNPETLDNNMAVRLRPEVSKSFFLASSCASSSFLLLRSCSILSNSPFKTNLKSCIRLHILSHSFSALSASWAKQSHWECKSFISSTTSSACVIEAVVMAAQTGPPRATGEGNWSGSRKGIGTRRGPLLNLAKNFSFLSLSHLLLLGVLWPP